MESLRVRRAAVPLGEPAPASRNNELGLFDERTGEWRDERNGSGRIQFGVYGSVATENVARELEQRVLKAAARAEEWNIVRARPFNGPECAVSICVGTARRAPDAVKRRQCLFVARVKSGGVQPARFQSSHRTGQPHRF